MKSIKHTHIDRQLENVHIYTKYIFLNFMSEHFFGIVAVFLAQMKEET